MKKKVLTTAMALAMLAPTATSFATTTVTGPESQSQNSQLSITGTVNNSTGQAPAGQISVTLPTAVSFVVDEDANLITANNMSIQNNSLATEVSVSVASFIDSTSAVGKGITVVGDLTDKDRSFVSLALSANGGTNGLTVQLLSTGVNETKLVDIEAGKSAGLALAGQAGQEAYDASNAGTNGNMDDIDKDGTSDTFTLVFKVAKKK